MGKAKRSKRLSKYHREIEKNTKRQFKLLEQTSFKLT